MYLTKLEVVGFKSFVNKTVFDFSKGVTSIVGPNGSGKSNVADAIRWALGEQSFKNLRGKKVDDIIFAGTEKRRALSFCEVSITFDNSDGFFTLDYSELIITRRAYRSGENEYFINGNSCRLKDITMLLHDTGVGIEGYSIIGQNKIETLIGNRSEHMRELLDEAAGVMTYKYRKDEAERKLSRTQSNIERIEDILDSLETQLEPLSIQSEQAKEYFETRDKLKALEATTFINNFDASEKKRERYINEEKELNKDIEEHKGQIDQSKAELSKAKTREKELEISISDYQQNVMELSSLIERQKGDTQLFEQKIEYIKENNKRLFDEIEDLKTQKEIATGQLNSFEEELSKTEAALREAEETAAGSRQVYEQTSSNIQKTEEKLENDKNELMHKLNKASEAKMQATRLNTIKAGMNERIGAISAEKERLHPLIDELTLEAEQLKEGEQKYLVSQKKLTADYNEVTSLIFEAQAYKEKSKENEYEIEKRISESASRIKIIEDMQKAYEGFNMPIKRLMQYSERDAKMKNKILGVVANVINVSPKYSKAIESALGAALQNIIAKDEEDGKEIINCLRENRFGIATILPLSVIRARELDSQYANIVSEPGCLGVASELIDYDKKYENIIKYLLARTLISDNMDNAIKIARRCRHSLKIVTLDGDILNPGGSMTGGGRESKTAGILEREQVLKEEKSRLEALGKELSELKKKASNAQDIEKFVSKQKQIAQEINDCNVSLAIEREKTETVQQQLKEKSEQLNSLMSEQQQLVESEAEIGNQLLAIDQTHTSVQSDHKELQNSILQETKTLAEIKKSIVGLLADYNEKNSIVTDFEKTHAILLNRISDKKAELLRLQTQVEEKQEKINENATNLENMLAGKKSQEEIDMQAELTEKKSELDELKSELNELKQDQQTLEEDMQLISNMIEEKMNRCHRIEMQTLKMESDIDTAIKTLYAEFEMTVDDAKCICLNEPIKNMSGEISMLREKLRGIGVINPNAIMDYNNVKSRYEELLEQKIDLAEAKEDLERIIKDLYSNMNKRFNTEFEKLNKLFNETFCEIFGGGIAEIRLLDENDKLNSQVEIIAQPPGKKLENMSLLSGGESALAAIALMLSVIKLKPTPFCVLDEIEASLDEANTFKLANYLKRYSNTSQFIMITHQKASMASSDVLYGVAMEEKGISKIVSVKMEQYEQEKAV